MLDEKVRSDLSMLYFIIMNGRESLKNSINVLEILHIHQIYDVSGALISRVRRRS
jgi:hypothetical protein